MRSTSQVALALLLVGAGCGRDPEPRALEARRAPAAGPTAERLCSHLQELVLKTRPREPDDDARHQSCIDSLQRIHGESHRRELTTCMLNARTATQAEACDFVSPYDPVGVGEGSALRRACDRWTALWFENVPDLQDDAPEVSPAAFRRTSNMCIHTFRRERARYDEAAFPGMLECVARARRWDDLEVCERAAARGD